METSSRRNCPTSWEPPSGADAGVFCLVFWREINTQTNPEHHYSPQPHIKQPKSLKTKQKTTVFLSHKTHCVWRFLRTRIVNFETHNEPGTFHNVCVLDVKLRPRLFVLLRMSCLTGQSRHETRKRDVASVHCWAGSQPMRNRFLLTQLSVWTMLAGIMFRKALGDIYSKHRRHLRLKKTFLD